ncbi:glycosyltransferase family 1 protein [Hydrogenophaga sp. 5NK40-0174]|uniref:glycosyltransferase family 4 protein n=1 Tax=Hydrogenophaga sp. 5NK40-0174 TaxID=3127649 RepID=UPI00310AD3DD
MRIVLVTDAWMPQVNGVVTTLVELVRHVRSLGHEVTVIEPSGFRTMPCPGYAGIDLAVLPGRQMYRRLRSLKADAIHIATEGPLGWAARRECKRRGLAFTTAFHTRFPEVVEAATGIPASWGYALLRRFHAASSAVMVPTRGMSKFLRERRFERLVDWTHGVDTDLFSFHETPTEYARLGRLARPVSLYVGRVSYEKDVQAFLEMDIPGSKVVCGEGPLRRRLQDSFPAAHWLGVLPRHELAKVYASADVLVFPSPNETFGLVMVESMSAGTPVAALPVEGPTEVIGESQAGALSTDLHEAWAAALKCSRVRARQRAEKFSWRAATHLFLASLVPAGPQHRSAVFSTRMTGRAQH